jgi:hypothetical protein
MPEPTEQQLLLNIVRDIAEIKADFKADRNWRERVEQRIEDHELRVRELEKARWQTAWVTAASSAALTAVVVGLISSLGA